MGRSHLYANFLQSTASPGAPVSIASGERAYIYERGTTVPIAQTMFETEDGSAVLTQPLQMDSGGSFEAWSEYPEPITLVLESSGASYALDFVENATSHGQMHGGTAKWDGLQTLNASTVAGTNVVTVPIEGEFGGFIAHRDIGKRIVVMQRVFGTGFNAANILQEVNIANGFIAGVMDATHAQMSVNATTTITYNPDPGNYSPGARAIWGSDDTLALQTLFDQFQSSAADPEGADLRLPAGIAMISAPLAFQRYGSRLVGAGCLTDSVVPYYGTVLVATAPGQSILRWSGEHNDLVGIGLEGAGKVAGIGLELAGPHGESLGLYFSATHQVRVHGCTTGMYGQNEQYGNNFHDLTAYRNTNGINLTKLAGVGQPALQKVWFHNLASEFNSANGIVMIGVESVDFKGGSSQQNQNGVLLQQNTRLVHFEDFQFEGNSAYAVNISRPTSGFANGAVLATFDSCAFYGSGLPGRAIFSDSALLCTWNGCLFTGFRGSSLFQFASAVQLANRFNAILPNCRFEDNGGIPTWAGQDGVHFGLGSAARISHSGNIAIPYPNAYPPTNYAPHWDTVYADPDLMLDATGITTGVAHPLGFTAARDGVYTITLQARFDGSAAGTYRQIGLLYFPIGAPTGTWLAIATRPPAGTLPIDLQVTATVRLVAGEWVDAYFGHDVNPGPLNVQGGNGFSPVMTITQMT